MGISWAPVMVPWFILELTATWVLEKELLGSDPQVASAPLGTSSMMAFRGPLVVPPAKATVGSMLTVTPWSPNSESSSWLDSGSQVASTLPTVACPLDVGLLDMSKTSDSVPRMPASEDTGLVVTLLEFKDTHWPEMGCLGAWMELIPRFL